MLEAFAEFFHLIEDLFSRETAIWFVIVSILAIILTALNATGVPTNVNKRTGKDKWINFKFR